jgi:pyruvate dehydrogenase complex dehydrogenase (E1) component
LAKNGEIKNKVVAEAIAKYKLDDPSAADPGSTAGDS